MPQYIRDTRAILSLKMKSKFPDLLLEEYPFDAELLGLSPLYRRSRKLYVDIGGSFRSRVCSTMRSLRSQDLFQDEIEFSPSLTELIWLSENAGNIFEIEGLVDGLASFNGISVFHEQNHRVVWRMMPAVPTKERDVSRFLNFAESLVVTLDLALGDELGPALSPALERLKAIYRPAGADGWALRSKRNYHDYLRSLFFVTYLLLEGVDRRDITKCVNYVLPGERDLNKASVKRGLELNELFTLNTNREWQRLYWKNARSGLQRLQKNSAVGQWSLPEDPLDFDSEFQLLDQLLLKYQII